MDSENQIVTKITADIAGLKQGVAEAKQTLQDFQGTAQQGFVVNWDGGSGSIEEFNAALAQQQAEWDEYLKQQAEAEAKQEEFNAQMAKFNDVIQQTIEQQRQLEESTNGDINAFDKLKEKVSSAVDKAKDKVGELADQVQTTLGNAKDAVYGYAKSIEDSDIRTKRALLAMSAAIFAFGIQSIKEYANYSANAKATQDSLAESLSKIKAAFGAVLQPIVGVIANIASLLAEHKELVAAIITTVGVIVGANGALAAFAMLKKALNFVAASFNVTRIAAGGLIGVLGLVAGGIAYAVAASSDFSSGVSENAERMAELEAEIAKTESQLESAKSSTSSAGSNARNEIAKVKKDLENLNFEFNQQLKQVAVNHEKTLQDLTRQIEEENFEYKRAIDERRTEFEVEQAKEAEEHQDKVDELTKQINFLQRYNNKYNKEKLKQLQYALEKENKLYEIRTQKEQEELDIQIANEEAAHQAKLDSLQAELDEELAFQNKHREALNGVRDVILLDEIESLKRQYDAQVTSYNEQLENAKVSGYNTGATFNTEYINGLQSKLEDLKKEYQELLDAEEEAKKAGKDSANTWLEDFSKTVDEWLQNRSIFRKFWKNLFDEQEKMQKSSTWNFNGIQLQNPNYTTTKTYATGGYTGYGAPDEIAGLVHKGEYVLRADQVDQSTGTPKNMGNNITINVSGTFATSASERRKVAEQIANALGQVQKARLM